MSSRTISTSVPSLAITEVAPLSPGQERLLDGEFALPDGGWPAPGTRTSLRPIDTGAVLIERALDCGALQCAVNALVVRQAALRTAFRELPDGTLVQLVAARLPDHVSRSETAPSADTSSAIKEFLRRSPGDVDPRSSRLFRVHLVRVDERRNVLLLQIHHLVSDGWSIGVLYRDLSELYNAAVQGRVADLPALPRTFASVCRQMRSDRGGLEGQRELQFWRARLGGPYPVMAFGDCPTTRPSPAGAIAVQPVQVPPWLVAALRETAHSSERRGGIVGPFLAALALVLYHRTATSDIRIGMYIANRARPDVEHLIGYFVNAAVFRLCVDPGLTLRHLVTAANTAVTEAIENQALPIQDLQQDLRDRTSLGTAPLFQVTVALNTMRTSSLTLAGLSQCRVA